MNVNSLPSERAAIVGVVDPDAYAAGSYTSDYFALKNFHRFMGIVLAGDLVASATLDAKFTVYTDGAGAGALDVPGAAMTQMTKAGSDDNKQAIVNFNVDAVAGNTRYTHARLTVTLGAAGGDVGAVVLGLDPRNAPASDSDATTVDSITTNT